MSDLADRLHLFAAFDDCDQFEIDTLREAADELNRLTSLLDRQKAAYDNERAIDEQTIERLTAERDQLRERVRVLEAALRGVLPWVVTQVVACNGLKCREDVCMSCNSDAEDNAQRACDAYCVADAALKEQT